MSCSFLSFCTNIHLMTHSLKEKRDRTIFNRGTMCSLRNVRHRFNKLSVQKNKTNTIKPKWLTIVSLLIHVCFDSVKIVHSYLKVCVNLSCLSIFQNFRIKLWIFLQVYILPSEQPTALLLDIVIVCIVKDLYIYTNPWHC